MTHPLHTFRYCPRCGAPDLQHPHGRALHCPQCELTYYHNVAAAVACIVLDDHGQILSVRRAREPAKGTLDLPGGFVDPCINRICTFSKLSNINAQFVIQGAGTKTQEIGSWFRIL